MFWIVFFFYFLVLVLLCLLCLLHYYIFVCFNNPFCSREELIKKHYAGRIEQLTNQVIEHENEKGRGQKKEKKKQTKEKRIFMNLHPLPLFPTGPLCRQQSVRILRRMPSACDAAAACQVLAVQAGRRGQGGL